MTISDYSARRDALRDREIASVKSGNSDEFYRIHSEFDALDDEFRSVQEIKEPSRFDKFVRTAGNYILGGLALAGLALTGAAKDMSGSSLDDVTPYFSEDNSEYSEVFDGQVGVESSETNCEVYDPELIAFDVFFSDEVKENESLDSLFIDNVIIDYDGNTELIWPNDTDPFLQRGNYNFTIEEWYEDGPVIKFTTKVPTYRWNHLTGQMDLEEIVNAGSLSAFSGDRRYDFLTPTSDVITLEVSDYDPENRTAFLNVQGIDMFQLAFDLGEYNQYVEEGNGSHLVSVAALESYDDDTPLYNVIEFAFEKGAGKNDLNVILPGEMGVSTSYDLNEHCVTPPSLIENFDEDTFRINTMPMACGLGAAAVGIVTIPAIIPSRKGSKTTKRVHVYQPRVETPKTPKEERLPKVPKIYDHSGISNSISTSIKLKTDEELEADIQGWKDISKGFELSSDQASEKDYYESLINTLNNTGAIGSYVTAQRTYKELSDLCKSK
jgi:hypothetical protein